MAHRLPAAGLALAVTSAATFGTSGAFATSLLRAGWTPGAAVTARVGSAALVLTVPAVRHLRRTPAMLRGRTGMLAVYGVLAVAGAQLCFFQAVAHLSVGVALLLEYLGTLLVVGWLWLRHAQRPRRLTVAGGVLAVAGLVLVLDLAGSHRLDPVGVLWGLGAAAGLAVYFVLSAAHDDPLPPLVVAWGGLGVGSVVLGLLGLSGVLPLRASTRNVVLLDHQVSWLIPVAGLSLIAAVIAYVVGIHAARVLGAKVSSFVGLTEVLFAVLFAWLLLGQVPTPLQAAGGVLVVAGVVLVRLDELRSTVAVAQQSARQGGTSPSRRCAAATAATGEAPPPARQLSR